MRKIISIRKRFCVQLFLVLLLICACINTGRAQSYDKSIELFSGQTDILTHSDVTRVSIGNASLADVNVLDDTGQILMIAKQPGVTDLRIWNADGSEQNYLVKIVSKPVADVMQQVRAHIAGIEGVSARRAGDRIIIEGQSLREEDLARVSTLSTQFPNVTNYVTPGGITLRGMIMLDVKVLEIRKNKLNNIGINWSDVVNGPTFGFLGDFVTNDTFRSTTAPIDPIDGILSPALDVGSNNSFFGLSTRLSSAINLLVQKGYAKLLAEPKLTCRSGGHAEFLVGGEVPIPISNSLGALNVTFKQFGIILNMAPISDPDGYVATNIEVEVSTVDAANSVLGIPGFATRRTETEMNVREGETMVISGLLSSSESKTVDKLPGLGNIPVIGELFKSREFRDDQTDLVIFVTPFIVDPDHKKNKELLRAANVLETEIDNDLRFNLLD